MEKPLWIQAPPKISPSKRAFEKYRPGAYFRNFMVSVDISANTQPMHWLIYRPRYVSWHINRYRTIHRPINRLICRPIYRLRGAQITQDPIREGYTQSNVRTITNKQYHRKVLLISYHLSDQNIEHRICVETKKLELHFTSQGKKVNKPPLPCPNYSSLIKLMIDCINQSQL